MPRKYFDQKLADLNRSMKEMGAVVDRRIGGNHGGFEKPG